MAWFTYTVAKFIPDPIKYEPVNVGVIVCNDDGQKETKFITNFDFLKTRYSVAGIDLFEDILNSFDTNTKKSKKSLKTISEDSKRNHRMEIEPPRVINSQSMKSAVNELYKQMISIPAKRHLEAISLVSTVRQMVAKKIKIQKEHVRRKHSIQGKTAKTEYDFVFGNGKISDVLQVISFDVADKDKSLYRAKSFVYDSNDIRLLNCLNSPYLLFWTDRIKLLVPEKK